jgi:hypothetical protein
MEKVVVVVVEVDFEGRQAGRQIVFGKGASSCLLDSGKY